MSFRNRSALLLTPDCTYTACLPVRSDQSIVQLYAQAGSYLLIVLDLAKVTAATLHNTCRCHDLQCTLHRFARVLPSAVSFSPDTRGIHTESLARDLPPVSWWAFAAAMSKVLLPQCGYSLSVGAIQVSVCFMQALTDALMSGHLGGAGLDVHWVVSASTQFLRHALALAVYSTESNSKLPPALLMETVCAKMPSLCVAQFQCILNQHAMLCQFAIAHVLLLKGCKQACCMLRWSCIAAVYVLLLASQSTNTGAPAGPPEDMVLAASDASLL